MITWLFSWIAPLAVRIIWAWTATGTMGWGRSWRYCHRPSHKTGSSSWSRSTAGGSEMQRSASYTSTYVLVIKPQHSVLFLTLWMCKLNSVSLHVRLPLVCLTHCKCTEFPKANDKVEESASYHSHNTVWLQVHLQQWMLDTTWGSPDLQMIK